MLTGVAAALGAALCWTLASGLWRRLPTSLGAAELNLLKNLLALGLLAPLLLWQFGHSPVPPAIPAQALALLIASGVLGIAAGDSFYFGALRRIGTRRTLTIDAGGPAVTAAAGALWLAEMPRPAQWLGIGLISLAVLLAALQRPAGSTPTRRQLVGVCQALAAVACGVGGALLARSVLRADALTPLSAAGLRLLGGSLALMPLAPHLLLRLVRPPQPRPLGRRWPLALVATLLGTSCGIALQQLALSRLPAGLAVALLATAPVLALPLGHWEGDRPGLAGVAAAALALLGVVLLSR
jgi:drug/metabolite transporter (DMT)-like permease